MDVVSSWTGARADALRRALRMTNEVFAEHLGVAVRTVAYWRARPGSVPKWVTPEVRRGSSGCVW
jgi:8-oxo-dGTP diphosphatase